MVFCALLFSKPFLSFARYTGSTVTVDLIEVSSAEGRTAQNPFTLTGESRTIELTKDTPVVTVIRGEDGSIEKVRLVQR